MMRRISLAVALLACLVGSCSPAQPIQPTQEPTQIVNQAVKNIRGASTFRLDVERTGAAYYFQTDVGKVLFRRASAQYVAPNTLQGRLRLIIAGLPTDITLFVRAEWRSGEPTIREPEKMADLRWFAWDALPQPLFLPIENLLRQGYDPFMKERLR